MLYIACLRAGAVYLPLNTAYTLAELEYFIGDAEPRLVVCSPAAQEALAPVASRYGARVETLDDRGGGTLLDMAQRESGQFEDVARGPDDLAAILYTSGTTGRSKGAMLTHDTLLSNAATLAESWRFAWGDRLIHALQFFFTPGLFVDPHIFFLGRPSIYFRPHFDSAAICPLLRT